MVYSAITKTCGNTGLTLRPKDQRVSQFDIDTKVTQTNDHIWSGTLSKSWNIGTNPNGGYLLSCVLSALKLALPHSDPITVTTHYLRPGTAGESFEVHVSVIRTGRTLSTARASLIQAGKVRLEVLAGFGDLQVSAGIETTLTVPPPVIPPPDACIQRHGGTQGVELPIASRLDVRLHPALALAGQSQVAMIAGWIRFLDGREPDTGTLPLFTDTFPPSPFGLLGVIGWVPTIELTVQVRCRPAPGWIQAEFLTEDLQQGRMIESGRLWDSQGQLVAQSRQIGLIMQQS
jgi:acyl-CoA thioesterase